MYVIFAGATVVTGALLGVILVLCIDCVLPFLLRQGKDVGSAPPPPPLKVSLSNDLFLSYSCVVQEVVVNFQIVFC